VGEGTERWCGGRDGEVVCVRGGDGEVVVVVVVVCVCVCVDGEVMWGGTGWVLMEIQGLPTALGSHNS
jgi:hypothetical protein